MHDEPPAAPVVQLITDVPGVHVELAVLGVTVNKVQVVLTPENEKIVMLGLQATGTTTVAVPLSATA